MGADSVIKASAVITMDAGSSRAGAIAIDSSTGRIVHVGTAAECVAIAGPEATIEDLGSSVIMPGFIDPHSHPVLSGMVTMEPVYWIAPYVGPYPDWAAVQAKFKEVDAATPAGFPVLFNGLDRLLQQCPQLTNTMLDEFFPSRPAIVIDNSGHEAYFNAKNMELLGWVGRHGPCRGPRRWSFRTES
jgi:predicted amidohydrolase YtcJ